jgi:DNA-binding FadR family transcriptional regulator
VIVIAILAGDPDGAAAAMRAHIASSAALPRTVSSKLPARAVPVERGY